MKTAAIANAYEQYKFHANKLKEDKAALSEYRIFDASYDGWDDKKEAELERRVQDDKNRLAAVLNTDAEKLPLIHPIFNTNKAAGTVLDLNV